MYTYLLNLSASGNIGQIHPPVGAGEAISAGGELLIGTRSGDEIELYLPSPAAPQAGSRPTETEIFKLFASLVPLELQPLFQPGFRGIEQTGDSPLSILLQRALAGGHSREVRPVRLEAEEDWTTVVRRIQIRRRR